MRNDPASCSGAIWSASDLAGDPHRAPDKAARVRAMFGAIAGRYDLNNRLHSFGLDQRWRRKAVALVAPGPSADVLDVACGTGDLAEAFADAGARSVTGLDFCPEMLDLARSKAARRKRAAGRTCPTYVEGDAQALPFEGGSFDVAAIAFGLRNVADPARAVAEFRRVLRPGGTLLILEFGEPRARILRWLNHLYSHRVMPVTAGLLAGDRSGAYRYLPRSIETFASADGMPRWLESHGFASARQRSYAFGVCRATIATR